MIIHIFSGGKTFFNLKQSRHFPPLWNEHIRIIQTESNSAIDSLIDSFAHSKEPRVDSKMLIGCVKMYSGK